MSAAGPKKRSSKRVRRASPSRLELDALAPRTRRSLRTWLLVADGAEAQIYDVEPVTCRLTPRRDGRLKQPNLPGHLLVSDKGGRTANSPGAARSAIGQRVDPHQRAEDRFLDAVARRINDASARRRFESLIIAAPPKAMARLRRDLNTNTQRRIAVEVTREWTNLSAPEISLRLIKVLIARK